jgi:hypothetical protein
MRVESANRERLRILTWQVHGNYLYYLAQAPHDFYLVTRPGHPPHYAGRTRSFPWPDNVYEIAPGDLPDAEFDLVLYQHREQWCGDRERLLSPAQQRLPCVYIEHDPPQEHPVDQPHWAQQADLLVHVTDFNRLMWDSGRAQTRVIDHGVLVPRGVRYSGEIAGGITAINHLKRRGRRLGSDVWGRLQAQVPLTLVGMEAESSPGGYGEVPNMELAAFMARYRFFLNPIRWTSLGLAVIEAMTVGLPIVGLATTELTTVIRNGENGWLETDPDKLVPVMRRLLDEPDTARRWGANARATALARFNIERFARDWDQAFREVVAQQRAAGRTQGSATPEPMLPVP